MESQGQLVASTQSLEALVRHVRAQPPARSWQVTHTRIEKLDMARVRITVRALSAKDYAVITVFFGFMLVYMGLSYWLFQGDMAQLFFLWLFPALFAYAIWQMLDLSSERDHLYLFDDGFAIRTTRLVPFRAPLEPDHLWEECKSVKVHTKPDGLQSVRIDAPIIDEVSIRHMPRDQAELLQKLLAGCLSPTPPSMGSGPARLPAPSPPVKAAPKSWDEDDWT